MSLLFVCYNLAMLGSVLMILATSLVIYYAGNKFAVASSVIGDYFNLSRSVKGATLDAVAGSFPELMIALFSVIFFHEFSIGVGTVAGSVMFNTLIIPSIAVFLTPGIFKVSKEVMARDVIFYNLAIIVFLASIVYTAEWGIALAVIFIGIYVWYLNVIIEQTKKYQNSHTRMLGEKISVTFNIITAVISMLVMGISAYYLTDAAIVVANILGVPSFIIGFSVIAVATSLPDTIIAGVNAKKGRMDDVMSNVFGSNIFNILIALGAPLLLISIISGHPLAIVSSGTELVIGLFISSVISTYVLVDDQILTRTDAKVMIGGYLFFLLYLFYRALVGV